jgi:hypothetical protein
MVPPEQDWLAKSRHDAGPTLATAALRVSTIFLTEEVKWTTATYAARDAQSSRITLLRTTEEIRFALVQLSP